MSTEQLKQEAMNLPLSERVSLAQALWENSLLRSKDTLLGFYDALHGWRVLA